MNEGNYGHWLAGISCTIGILFLVTVLLRLRNREKN